MKKMKLVKRLMICFSMVVTLLSVIPSVPVNAAVNAAQTKYVNGNGVRLRQEGWTGGAVLELMYDGEKISYYPDIFGSDPEYNYMKRIKTGTYGYVDHHYTRYNP